MQCRDALYRIITGATTYFKSISFDRLSGYQPHTDTVLCTIYMETYLLLQTIAVFCKISLYLYCLYYSLLSLVIKYWKIGAFQLFMLRAINYYFILYLVVSVSGTY